MTDQIPFQTLSIPGNYTGIEPLFTALRWGTEQEAKDAWEKANARVKNVSVWRTAIPVKRPYTDFVCIIMGERKSEVQKAFRVLSEVPGWTWFELAPEFARSLAIRRYSLAVQGRKSLTVRDKPRLMDKEGRMHPYDEGTEREK